MNTSTQEHLSVRITGRVQGVGFRAFARRTARRLGLDGWVRNERDGSVCLQAEGGRDELEELLDALKSGPRAARVENVSADWGDANGSFERFSVRR